MRRAFITGITGQDGSYLAELLLENGYEVHGLVRRASSLNTQRIDHLKTNGPQHQISLKLHTGDLSDSSNILRLLEEIRPSEIYNLGAQSHVAVSFASPEYTADVDAIGVLRLLEGMRILGIENKCKFYQASTSELYGQVQEVPQKETTPFYPRSPYAVAKLYAYWITVNYREAYGMFACNGILFNHESPRRGENFVTRKITRSLARIVAGIEDCLYVGNIEAKRDWGHARDYVFMQYLMLQQELPRDLVIATGRQHSVREFIEKATEFIGIELEWRGKGLELEGVIRSTSDRWGETIKVGQTIVRIDPAFYRPTEVETLLGDPSLASKYLNWTPSYTFEALVQEMMDADLYQVMNARA